MAGRGTSSSLLLALPDPCLLEVMRSCAGDDQRSLFSAARAHSRLHQAAVLALRSITAVITQQQQVDGVLLYLSKHGQHVDSTQMEGPEGRTVALRALPYNVQLGSLQLSRVRVQLPPKHGLEGVLGPAARVAGLKQLRLDSCDLPYIHVTDNLAAALSLLPAGLEHLSIRRLVTMGGWGVPFPMGMLQQLQQLTYFELADMWLKGPDQEQQALQPLQALTRLADLRLVGLKARSTVEREYTDKIFASMLSGTHNLTCLVLSGVVELQPGVLAGKTKLQRLELHYCAVPGGAAGASQLLSHLQQLQQLTHLRVAGTWADQAAHPPAAAYSALTASSELQDLSVCGSALPTGAWQHMFPVDRQLPHLQYLDLSEVRQPGPIHGSPSAPDFSRLVSCCPGLQTLNLLQQRCKPQLLAPLQRLTALQMGGDEVTAEDLQEVSQLTGLRQLTVVSVNDFRLELLLPLTELKELTTLHVLGRFIGSPHAVHLTSKVGHMLLCCLVCACVSTSTCWVLVVPCLP
mgnify:CR=1 FL=1